MNMSSCSFKFVSLFVVACSTVLYTVDAACTWGEYDFSSLDGFEWTVEQGNNTYNISLCKPLSSSNVPAECKDGVSVCHSDDQGAHSYGSYASDLLMREDSSNHDIYLTLNGSACASEDTGNVYKSIIIFKCGKTLGSPVLLHSYDCDTYFEWHTTAACRTVPNTPPVKEVKCYVYNDTLKYDLSPLIKLKGGYLVSAVDATGDFYINVCRDITPDGSTSACPHGSGACLVSQNTPISSCQPNTQLSMTGDGQLELTYTSDQHVAGCDTNPTTKITFTCPERGGGKDPLLISSMNCQYVVEWATEYACNEETLIATNCKFSLKQHGIDFDLTPLRKEAGGNDLYVVSHADTAVIDFKYYINICGNLGIECPENVDEKVAVCQLHEPDDNFGKVLGKLDDMKLRYADGDLVLTYGNGDACHSHFKRNTVINFICNKNASNDGIGMPVFNTEDDCTYIFDWETKYACPSHSLDSKCRVDVGNKMFDLSSLIRNEKDKNWEALQTVEGTAASTYFINICRDVLLKDEALHCPAEAAACSQITDENGVASFISLGKYVSSPTYIDSVHSILLHYTEGSKCANQKTIETFLNLRCKPGDSNSPPVFVRKSNDGCVYEFEWDTSAACVLSQKEGSNCKVYDDDVGYTFDLTKLTMRGQEAFYKVSGKEEDGHDFFINVCDKVSGTDCNGGENDDAGVCQVPKQNPSHHNFNAGKPSSKLVYYDGMITLKYVNGTQYHSSPPVARMSEISFLCDPNTGRGQPRFVAESNHTYSFEWFTVYACPEAPVECAVVDHINNKQYDLSSLSKSAGQDNWVAFHTDSSGRRRNFYLNVCRPLNPVKVGSGCDAIAAGCATEFINDQEHLSISSLGQAKSRPKVEEGGIVLEYTSGYSCNSDKLYTTKIHLRCKEGALTDGPTFTEQVNECEFSFLWETNAACPVGETHIDTLPCSVTDPTANYTFNLQPLTKKGIQDPYSVDTEGKTWKLNICGAVTGCGDVLGGPPAVCDGQTGLAKINDMLTLSQEGHISLTYRGNRDHGGVSTDVVINFLCKEGVDIGQPVFVRKDHNIYLFEFETSLACPPKPVDCSVTDEFGHEYDLSALARQTGNWRVLDTRAEHNDLTYFINVCRPINLLDGGVTCAGGPVGGCQVDSQGNTYNLGYIQGRPQANSESLLLRYYNGDKCHGEYQRSTEINFFCSATEQDPVFVSETDDCKYIINWNTPYACPWKRSTGKDCKVKDPLHDVTFDLSYLTANKNYEVTSGEYKYFLNVCGPLKGLTGECSGDEVGACQTKAADSTFMVNAGKFSSELTFEAGIITLKYTDGKAKCHQKYNRTTLIKFICDTGKSGQDGPHFVNETSDCSYIFEWPTSYACTPAVFTSCSATDDKQRKYDLGSLVQSNNNYEYSQDTSARKFVLNVCGTIVQRPDITCPVHSAACLIDLKEKDGSKRFKSIGELRNPQTQVLNVDSDGRLIMTYTSNDKCPDQKRQKTTVIVFECDKDNLNGEPELTDEDADCLYTFRWKTFAACPIGTTPPVVEGDDCKVTNPETNYEFDLSGLRLAQGYSTTDDQSGYNYQINVCAPLQSSPCGVDAGSCQESKDGSNAHWNAGKANSKLQHNMYFLSLNYSNGDICHHNNSPRSTMLYFVCGAKDTGKGSPVFVVEDDCSYHVSWHTELACERRVDCSVEYQGQALDLSPLVKSSGHYLAISTLTSRTGTANATYYINVCRPLNPIYGKLCPPGAAACKIIEGEKPVSLGHVTEGPSVDTTNGKVTLVYKNGVPCPHDSAKNTTSKIVFTCERGLSEGEPHLETITEDCQYLFTWPTNVICPQTAPDTSAQCSYTDSRTLYTYDFSNLLKTGAEGYQVQYGKGHFYINMCGAVVDTEAKTAGCGNTPVCFIDDNGKGTEYGSSSDKVTIMEGEAVKVVYQGGSPCPTGGGSRKAVFLLSCARDVGEYGTPSYVHTGDNSCDAIFEWETHLACAPMVEECSFGANGNVYDLSLLSRENSSWSLSDTNGNKYWLNLCQGIQGGPDATLCPNNAAACRQTSAGDIDVLGTVQTQQMHTDGEVLIVEYTEGSSVCSDGRRRTPPEKASTKLKFTCGNTVGGPVFVPSESSSCEFVFHWQSKIACKEERVPVGIKDGLIEDPRSGTKIDISAIGAKSYPVDIGQFKYLIDINGKNPTSGCSGAAICQTSPKPLILGDKSSAKYFMEDDILEVVYTSETPCATEASKKISSVIDFHCQAAGLVNLGPTFTYKSKGCHFLFDWFTPQACSNPDVINPDPLPSVGGGTSNAAGLPLNNNHRPTAAIVVSVFAVVILVGILLIVFHKAERRSAFMSRVRNLFGRAGSLRRMQYSRLSAMDEAEDTLLGGNPFGSEEYGGVDEQPSLPAFHDDSDDDMLL